MNKAAIKLLKSLGVDPRGVNFSVAIVGDEEMRELNKKWRGKDASTDVLSFPNLDLQSGRQIIGEDEDGNTTIAVEQTAAFAPADFFTAAHFPLDTNPATGKVELGDIVINENEADPEFLIQHGLLHLLGFEHD